MSLFKAHANGRNKCQQLPTLLGVVGQQCCVRLHRPKSLTGFKLYATSANKCQHCCGSMQQRTQQVTTLLGPTMLGAVGQQCWVRLHGPLGSCFVCFDRRSLGTLAVHLVCFPASTSPRLLCREYTFDCLTLRRNLVCEDSDFLIKPISFMNPVVLQLSTESKKLKLQHVHVPDCVASCDV